ncbi:MAG: phosphomannomutase/phosphoglucomutase, partial [Patescibacteria group bacterium]
REKSASFGGELSMHFYFSDLWNCESGDLAMLVLLKRLVREGKPLSELWTPLRRYAKSEEMNFKVSDPVATIQSIEKRYAQAATKMIRTDGVRIEFGDGTGHEDWWFSVRASNTEHLARLNVEAKTQSKLEEKVGELRALIV